LEKALMVVREVQGDDDNWFYFQDFSFYYTKVESMWPWFRSPKMVSVPMIRLVRIDPITDGFPLCTLPPPPWGKPSSILLFWALLRSHNNCPLTCVFSHTPEATDSTRYVDEQNSLKFRHPEIRLQYILYSNQFRLIDDQQWLNLTITLYHTVSQ
jgi:hypothetical protein